MTDAFVSDPRRDASAVIRGFVYQVDVTIQRWIELEGNERLELERGEDIDLVARGIAGNEDERRLTEQVKSREENLTLRSAAAVQSVANFALHRERNPGLNLLFRFTTNAGAGAEQGVEFPASLPGIIAWRRVQLRTAGESEEVAIARALREFYREMQRPSGISEETWSALERVVSADDRAWLGFVAAFEWSVEGDAPATLPPNVQSALIASGLASANDVVQKHERLFVHVFRLLAVDGEKVLTRSELEDVLAVPPDPSTHAQIVALLTRVASLEVRMVAGEERLSNVEGAQQRLSVAFDGMATAIAAQLPSIGVVPIALSTEAPAIPAYRISRDALVQRLRSDLPCGWLALHGDVGSGKTQLADLVAQQNGSVVWLRFIDVPPFIAAVALRRYLAEITNHQPAPTRDLADALFEQGSVHTIILDDLPRLDGRSPLIDDLVAIARSASAAGALVISTSLHLLPAVTADALVVLLFQRGRPDRPHAVVATRAAAGRTDGRPISRRAACVRISARCIVERTSCAAAREDRFSAGRRCPCDGIRSSGPDRF
jgi:hypothetical protein